MTGGVPAAFYAPLKSPDAPTPSGDRSMARLFLAALGRAGFAPELACRLRSFEPAGEAAAQSSLREASLAEAERIGTAFRAGPAQKMPRLWFTYHCYYKAPDWVGPAVARRLGIPYVLAEGSRAGKRAGGPWALGHAGAEAALDGAAVLFAMTANDRQGLWQARPSGQAIVDLPPFLDLAGWPSASTGADREAGGPLRLLTVAMMRDGDKLRSYRLLADALERLGPSGPSWTLDLVGGGVGRHELEALFSQFGSRVTLHGVIEDRARLAALYRRAHLLVWPAVNEAYGMALLEAQAMGCPVLAGRYGGVADAVRDGATGILVPPQDPAAYAAALAGLLGDRPRLARMGVAAEVFVRRERDLDGAAAILRSWLRPLIGGDLAA